jgi:uncharacterized peroxidase-related enzyme
MPNIEPLRRDQLPEFEEVFEAAEATMGFVPNSLFTMGRRPEILRGFMALAGATLGPGTVDRALKQMVAHIASNSAGCRYCQAHTASTAVRLGAGEERIGHVYEFETSPLFSEGERAALRMARDAALVPNATTPEHFDALRPHFSDEQVVELVAVIGLFGFLNRWNDTMATALEDEPLDFAARHLSGRGWAPGKHRS